MKRNFPRILALVAILALLGTLLPATADTAGAWKVNKKVGSHVKKADKKVLAKAVKKQKKFTYTPILTLATQAVSGKNAAYLCKVTKKKGSSASWKVVLVSKNTKGKVKLLKVTPVDLGAIKTLPGPYTSSGQAGAWVYVTQPSYAKGMPGSVERVFDKATETLTGIKLTPLALLGTQVVSGKNYRFLCRGMLADAANTTCLYVVDIHQDLDGACTVYDKNVLDLPGYLE